MKRTIRPILFSLLSTLQILPAWSGVTRNGQNEFQVEVTGHKNSATYTYAPDAIPGTDLAILSENDGNERIYISRSCEVSRVWLSRNKQRINYGMLSVADQELLNRKALDLLLPQNFSDQANADWLSSPPGKENLETLTGYLTRDFVGTRSSVAEQIQSDCRPLEPASVFGTAGETQVKVGDTSAEEITQALSRQDTLKISKRQLKNARNHPCRVWKYDGKRGIFNKNFIKSAASLLAIYALRLSPELGVVTQISKALGEHTLDSLRARTEKYRAYLSTLLKSDIAEESLDPEFYSKLEEGELKHALKIQRSSVSGVIRNSEEKNREKKTEGKKAQRFARQAADGYNTGMAGRIWDRITRDAKNDSIEILSTTDSQDQGAYAEAMKKMGLEGVQSQDLAIYHNKTRGTYQIVATPMDGSPPIVMTTDEQGNPKDEKTGMLKKALQLAGLSIQYNQGNLRTATVDEAKKIVSEASSSGETSTKIDLAKKVIEIDRQLGDREDSANDTLATQLEKLGMDRENAPEIKTDQVARFGNRLVQDLLTGSADARAKSAEGILLGAVSAAKARHFRDLKDEMNRSITSTDPMQKLNWLQQKINTLDQSREPVKLAAYRRVLLETAQEAGLTPALSTSLSPTAESNAPSTFPSRQESECRTRKTRVGMREWKTETICK